MIERRPNPKALTDADRILSVSEKLRRQLIAENTKGKGSGHRSTMKILAKRYGIPEKTVRVIIHDAKHPATKAAPSDLWERPDLWHDHGIKCPCTPRMVELTHERARRYRS